MTGPYITYHPSTNHNNTPFLLSLSSLSPNIGLFRLSKPTKLPALSLSPARNLIVLISKLHQSSPFIQIMIALRCPPAVCSSSPSANSFKPTPCIVAFVGSSGKNCKKSCRFSKKVKASLQPAAAQQEEEEEEDFQVLTAVQTSFNNIVIVDTCKSRLLLLDSTHNVHSMLNKESKWTGSYWDEFGALPAVVPPGPIAIFGLGGGTAAHLMLDLWPSLQLEGWEIDETLIHKSRDYFGLSDLEKHTTEGGVLNIHIGDVFSSEAAISGGYAGIIVDLFAEGKVLPQLEQAATWLQLCDKLMPGGRFMVNCGGAGEGEDAVSQDNGSWKLNATIRALCEAFPGQVNWKKMPKSAGENYLALTGSLPDLSAWSAALPSQLNSSINQWDTCN